MEFDLRTLWYTESTGGQGKNHTYSDTATPSCRVFKALFRLSLHMAASFVPSMMKFCKLN
ncbi:transposase [Acinetobacter bouvetii]|uniref:transposase n=1 Tax=Acinetobacter bouvetii TaxID=202951 RepID=UPI0009D6EB99